LVLAIQPSWIERAVAEHLEILRMMCRRCVGVRLLEGVGHANAFDRLLGDAVNHVRRPDVGGLEDRRRDVDDVVELMADAAGVLDHLRPGDCHSLPGAAEMRGDLLGPAKRCVERPGPAHRHMRVGLVRTPDIVEISELVLDRNIDAVEADDLARRPEHGAFRARAVIAADVYDQRVVELAHVLDGLDHAADFVVCVGEVGAIDVRLADEYLLSSAESVSHFFNRSSGHGVSLASCGITPNRF
jgi:hypothetical protein